MFSQNVLTIGKYRFLQNVWGICRKKLAVIDLLYKGLQTKPCKQRSKGALDLLQVFILAACALYYLRNGVLFTFLCLHKYTGSIEHVASCINTIRLHDHQTYMGGSLLPADPSWNVCCTIFIFVTCTLP